MESIISPRKRRAPEQSPPVCPVCGVSLRPNDVAMHFALEIDKLDKLSFTRVRKSLSNSPPAFSGAGPSTSSGGGLRNGDATTGSADDCWGTFQRIKNNRQSRLKIKPRKRKPEETQCPVCNRRGIEEDISLHVEKCLRRSENGGGRSVQDSDEESIDVGGGESYEEYEFAGQTRIRASSMLPGGSYSASLKVSSSATSEDETVNVDVDETTQLYGPPQFSERDVIVPISRNENDSYLRDLIIGNEPPAMPPSNNETSNSGAEQPIEPPEPIIETAGADTNHIIESLKAKIREYERYIQNRPKCVVCMDDFKKPIVSVCCWHVLCQECWLRSLAKKICPQCNVITTPADLRRIYL